MGDHDAIAVRFEGGPLDGQTRQMHRMLLNEVIQMGASPADLTGESAWYLRTENVVHWDADGAPWVRYSYGPLYEPPDLSELPDEIDQRPSLRHVINDALEAWPDASDRDMPSWWYDPDELKELARHIRDAIASKWG